VEGLGIGNAFFEADFELVYDGGGGFGVGGVLFGGFGGKLAKCLGEGFGAGEGKTQGAEFAERNAGKDRFGGCGDGLFDGFIEGVVEGVACPDDFAVMAYDESGGDALYAKLVGGAAVEGDEVVEVIFFVEIDDGLGFLILRQAQEKDVLVVVLGDEFF